MKLYLDVCCLNRPFDDQSQPRVALEAAAIIKVFEEIEASRLTDYSSEMARIEIERMPDHDRRRKVAALLPPESRIMPLSNELLDLSESMMEMGFTLSDAVHLSAATQMRVDVFVTVDDGLLRQAKRHAGELGIRVVNPVSLLKELKNADDR